MRHWVSIVCLFVLAAPGWAQFDGWGPEQIIKYTPTWTGERFADGRPKVPDSLIQRLKDVQITSEEAAWGPLRIIHRYEHQWEGGWKILNRNKRLIGRAFTCRFMPGRLEVAKVIEDEARAKDLSQHNVRVMDLLQPGDVIVADMAGGRVRDGVFVGDNLAVAIYSRTGNGFVVHGGIRDREGIEPHGFPLYYRGEWPGVFGDLMLTGINVPIQVGEVTVMPGDVVAGDSEGLTFIPPHTVEDIVDNAELYDAIDEWRKEKFLSSGGAIKPSDLYGRIGMRDPAMQQECEAYVRNRLREKGLKAPEERRTWKERGYSGSGCFDRRSAGPVGEKK
jgi:4-hydroxy-4-methyl-2-oxoglutarate aldolase